MHLTEIIGKDGGVIVFMLGTGVGSYLGSSLLLALGRTGPAHKLEMTADLVIYGSLVGVAVKVVRTVLSAF